MHVHTHTHSRTHARTRAHSLTRGAHTHAHTHRYYGEVVDCCAEGYGVHKGSSGVTYSGQWAKGNPDGHLVWRWPHGDVSYYLCAQGTTVHVAREIRHKGVRGAPQCASFV